MASGKTIDKTIDRLDRLTGRAECGKARWKLKRQGNASKYGKRPHAAAALWLSAGRDDNKFMRRCVCMLALLFYFFFFFFFLFSVPRRFSSDARWYAARNNIFHLHTYRPARNRGSMENPFIIGCSSVIFIGFISSPSPIGGSLFSGFFPPLFVEARLLRFAISFTRVVPTIVLSAFFIPALIFFFCSFLLPMSVLSLSLSLSLSLLHAIWLPTCPRPRDGVFSPGDMSDREA